MKFQCDKSNLVQGVQIVQRAVSTKNTMPILGGILLETTDNDEIVLKATDLEMGIKCSIKADIIEPGSIVLPSKYFSELVRKLPDLPITFETNQNAANIIYGDSQVVINGFDPEEFPILPSLSDTDAVNVPGDLLKHMIRQVSVAVSKDESRPVFTGILTEINENQLRLVSTDTHRLSCRTGVLEKGLSSRLEIIPGKTLTEVSRLINDEESITISFDKNQVLFKIDNISLISRLIEGQFPDYKQVIPKEYSTKVRLETKTFLQVVERASLLAGDEGGNKANVIKISFSENSLIINMNSPDVGKLHEKVPAYIEGEEIKIAFNSKYLIDVLKVVDDEEVYLELSGTLSPGIIKPVTKDNYLYLILPIRTV
ncbi:DNA polymerase III subunit beta [Metallumcola ferriviriculae]|uniref:Beta sliding clamp n=1 Tax=Metallumcola ferriviriculae TaxID=3039180 RepID=A0AAU0UH06_9FIRM|nr:DNA polymerase III subunit beta [Desulfitibacteraceae bacterium MK1]